MYGYDTVKREEKCDLSFVGLLALGWNTFIIIINNTKTYWLSPLQSKGLPQTLSLVATNGESIPHTSYVAHKIIPPLFNLASLPFFAIVLL